MSLTTTAGLSRRLHAASGPRSSRPSAPRHDTKRPPRRLSPSGGLTDWVGVDVEDVTPALACATPSKKCPAGRTGTIAGVNVHRSRREPVCSACLAAAAVRASATYRANMARRTELVDAGAPACTIRSQKLPGGSTGTYFGYRAHIVAQQRPCEACATVMTAPLACARPSRRYPTGRTGTDAGYQAHVRERQPSCEPCHSSHLDTTNASRATPEGRARRQASYLANWDSYAEANIRRYGLTMEKYRALLAAQGGVCAICGSADAGGRGRFSVDHDHRCCPERLRSCGKCVRGLLCSPCNTGIGLLRDDPERLIAAAAYLTASRLTVAV